ncbi:hypothetical protein L917_08038 [Phytophthora nicotianae]|uniref:Uncharacterized protein n=1 Tax=Phytophthora nicotianae TaxID=4792 RepID=W2LAW4_PHYNI|nr:hypothetical protein L917_08038 [Phytophthora nicotianae]
MTSDLILEVTGGFRDVPGWTDFLSERDILVRRRLVNAVPLLQRNAPAVQATRAYTSKLADNESQQEHWEATAPDSFLGRRHRTRLQAIPLCASLTEDNYATRSNFASRLIFARRGSYELVHTQLEGNGD